MILDNVLVDPKCIDVDDELAKGADARTLNGEELQAPLHDHYNSYETLPTFEDPWTEYYGDPSLYRKAIEDNDIQDWDNKLWHYAVNGVSPSVVNKNTDRPVPEDFVIHDQLRSNTHFPQTHFSDGAMSGDGQTYRRPCAKPSEMHSISRHLLKKISKVKRGIASFVNGARLSVIADTGVAVNVISAEYAKQNHMAIDTSFSSFKLGNSSLVDSVGTVSIDYAFAETPSEIFNIVCHVLPHCIYDLILGSTFLTATQTISKYRSRLTECIFSVANVFHFGYLGNSQQVLEGTLADQFITCAISDTGAERNVMDLQYVTFLMKTSPFKRPASFD